MSTANAPFGFRPIYHPSGIVRPKAYPLGIASGFATNIFKGTGVLLTTAGVLNPTTANNVDFLGVFAGVEYTPSGGRPVVSPFWPASTVLEAGAPMTAYVWDDPTIVYEVQADGAIAQTAIGDQVNTAAGEFTTGSTQTGLSSSRVAATPVGVGVQGMWRVLGLSGYVDNTWGDAFTMVQVNIARPQYVAVKVAI